MKTNQKTARAKNLLLAWLLVTSICQPGLVFAQWNINGCDFASTVGFYPFLGSARNLGGSGLDGTVSGADYATDRFGNARSAYHFNGSSDQIGCGNSLKPSFPFTIAMWVKRFSDGRLMGIFSSGTWASRYYGVQIVLWGDGVIDTVIGNGGPNWSSSRKQWHTATNCVAVGQWAHIAVVWASINNAAIYFNGNLIPGGWDSTGTGNSLAYDSAATYMGWSNAGGTPNQFFDGIIDDLSVYNRALSAAEILVLYNAPNPAMIDSDGDSYDNREEVLAGMSPCDGQEHPAAHLSKYQRVRLDISPTTVTNFTLQSTTNLVSWGEIPGPYEGTLPSAYLPFDASGAEFYRATIATNLYISRAIRWAFPSVAGTNYQVQYSSNTVQWVNFGAPISGTGNSQAVFSPFSFDQYFLRVINP